MDSNLFGLLELIKIYNNKIGDLVGFDNRKRIIRSFNGFTSPLTNKDNGVKLYESKEIEVYIF